MHVLGLQGSPRKNGNTDYLMQTFLEKARQMGAGVELLQIPEMNIQYCKGCGYCEKKGFCVIRDDEMADHVYPKLRQADLVVLGSPVFFYGICAQLKTLIDRGQALWSRKHVFKLKDPLSSTRKGVALSVAASRGKSLFEGVDLTAKYFFDAVDAEYVDQLFYRGIEAKGKIKSNESVHGDMEKVLNRIVPLFLGRKKVLFVGRKGSLAAPVAAAFTRLHGGRVLDAAYVEKAMGQAAGPDLVSVLSKYKLDMAFGLPDALKQGNDQSAPDLVIHLDVDDDPSLFPKVKREKWELNATVPMGEEQAKGLCERIRQKVELLVSTHP